MTAPVDAVELRRVVWRHEHGRTASGLAALEGLEEEYRRALQALHSLEGGRAAVRAHDPDLLVDCDAALYRARRALGEEALSAALDALLRARELLARMRELLDAHAAVRRAGEAVERLRSAVRHPRLRTLPCMDVPARLLLVARERMREGAWTRAATLAAACTRQASGLEPDAPPAPGRAAALGDALEALRALCAATRDAVPVPAADPCGDGTLDAAGALAEEGWPMLAERVVEELGALLAPRARFRAALEQDPEGRAAAMAELRRRLSDPPGDEEEEPWTAATRLLWRARVDDGLRRIRQEQARLERVRTGAGDPATHSWKPELQTNATVNPGDIHEQPDL